MIWGCGSGKITANIAGRAPKAKIFRLDLSQGMVEFANNNYSSFLYYLAYEKQDIEKPAMILNFDLICSFSALHWGFKIMKNADAHL